jgi:DNA-binding transcriptional MerR regulator
MGSSNASDAAPVARNLGSAAQAAAIAHVTPATIRNWLLAGLIRGERTGSGHYRYDLDDCAAMTISFPRSFSSVDLDERIRQLVENAPELSAGQLERIRMLLRATPQQRA